MNIDPEVQRGLDLAVAAVIRCLEHSGTNLIMSKGPTSRDNESFFMLVATGPTQSIDVLSAFVTESIKGLSDSIKLVGHITVKPSDAAKEPETPRPPHPSPPPPHPPLQ